MTDSIENILKYLREGAGFAIDIRPNVPLAESACRQSGRPASEEQALVLLKQAMAGIGCMVLQKGRLLRIITAHEAKKHYLPLPTIRQG